MITILVMEKRKKMVVQNALHFDENRGARVAANMI